MEVTKKTRLQYRIQAISFVILFLAAIGLLAWLSHTYNFESDWTANQRNTLSEASVKLLEHMEDPIKVTVFLSERGPITQKTAIEELIKRYQKIKPDIELNFINPDTAPDKTRKLNITVDGELIVEYNRRNEHIQNLNEETFTNALQRLMRSGEKAIVFITGHGERNPKGIANHDLGQFTKHLDKTGIKTSILNLATQPLIPGNTSVLVIASPQIAYLPGEVKLIQDYIKQGGNLLWLHEPGELYGLDTLANDLGIRFHPGVIVDPTTQLLGIPNPSFALVASYPEHPINSNFSYMTIYPQSSGIAHTKKEGWTAVNFLQSVNESWSETSALEGRIGFDETSDTPGPLTIGIALTKSAETEKGDSKTNTMQRITILGDGDFLSNEFLGNQGNLSMGQNILNWLSHDDNFIDIPAKTAPDTNLTINETSWGIIGIFFVLILPILLAGTGITIWLRRRKR